MRALRPLLREIAHAFYSRALKEIHPLHPDVPLIVLTLHRLDAERRGA